MILKAVSIGFPATLDAERRTVLLAPNIAFMEKLPVVEALSGRFGIPVLIERDVTMALYYDCRKYGISKDGIVCGFYFGTGIGNAPFLQRFVDRMAMAVATEVNILDPANNLNIIFTGDEEAKCVIGGAIYAKERGLG